VDDIITRVTSVQFKPPIDKRRHHSCVMSNRMCGRVRLASDYSEIKIRLKFAAGYCRAEL
jgi:hypothetical protein